MESTGIYKWFLPDENMINQQNMMLANKILCGVYNRLNNPSRKNIDPGLSLVYKIRVKAIAYAFYGNNTSQKFSFLQEEGHADDIGWFSPSLENYIPIIVQYHYAIHFFKRGNIKAGCSMFSKADDRFNWLRNQEWLDKSLHRSV